MKNEWKPRPWVVEILILVLVLLIVWMNRARGAEPNASWRWSDRLYKDDTRTPYSLEMSQPPLRKLAMQSGYAGPEGNGPGYRDTVLGIDGDRAAAGTIRFLIAPPADTLWKALISPDKWMPGECSYVAIVKGGAAPDSLRFVLADGVTFTKPIERRRK